MTNLCFATMALGAEYRELATLLARDLTEHCRDTRLVILTDKPHHFERYDNVETHSHTATGNWYCYHDKRYAVATALRTYQTCVFVDADSRLLEKPPIEEMASLPVGIYGFDISSIKTKLNAEIKEDPYTGGFLKNTPMRRKKLLLDISRLLGIDYENTLYIQEAFMIFTRQENNDRTDRFISTWDYIAKYMSTRRYEWGEGETIGLAAMFTGWKINAYPNVTSWLLKDLYRNNASNTRKEIIDTLLSSRETIGRKHRKKSTEKLYSYFHGGINYIKNSIRWMLYRKRMLRELTRKS